MKNCKTISAVLIILAVIAFHGCTTLKYAGKEQAQDLIELINLGNYEELALHSSENFLLDAEILQSPILINDLWRGLADSGFRLSAAQIEDRILNPEDRALFGKGPEIDAFFAKYLPGQPTLLKITASSSLFLFIIGPSADTGFTVYAFGGPY